jgi:biotin operon repressor
LIENKEMNMNELAAKLNITNGALTGHIKKLEACGIVNTSNDSSGHGNQKICTLHLDIINTVVKTKRTRDNVRLMIPVLIHWAKTGQNRHTYGDLIHLIGKTRFSGIGHSLYAIQEVLNKLSEETEKEILKKIMESSIFWYYIKTTSKPYSSDYYSLNGNYIKNFGVCELTEKEKKFLIKETDQNILNEFFEDKYEFVTVWKSHKKKEQIQD